MALKLLILFSLCCLIRSQETTDPISLDDCCKDGREKATESQDCTRIPLISESTTCRIAQEQCCAAVLEDITCSKGIIMAKDQNSCDALLSGNTCETKTAKVCCECCLLGQEAQKHGLTCDFKLSSQCGSVFQSCCQKKSAENDSNSSQDSTVIFEEHKSGPGEECKVGPGNCAHNCIGNNTCTCFTGYKLKPDGKNCEDINECLLGSHHCRPGEACINTLGLYRCQRETSCGTGYELTDSNSCKDIDECETGTHNCPLEFECQNTPGSFRCRPKMQCHTGFIQDALGSCIDINECLTLAAPCSTGQVCLNTVGSYTCQRNSVNCGRGYHLNAEGTRCVDIDECTGGDDACAGHSCVNLVGSYRCECRTGFNFNSITRTCEDINECRHYPGRLCAHKCDNILGSYKCSCTTGFKLASDGRNCDDLNECDSNPCSQECANVYGSFQCYCRRGYQLSDVDGSTCEDIDECALPTGGHICSYRCHNTPGSFHCTCPVKGYTLASNGRSCQDIDECVAGTHTCSETESCFNIQGGFRCLNFGCPTNYRRSSETRPRVDRSEIIRCIKSCQPNDITCVLDPVHSVSHTVISLPTFREFTKPEEIVFLRSITPSHYPHVDSPEIVYDIQEGNVQSSFDIIKRFEHGMIVGVVRQVKPLVGPLSTVLKLAMNYVTNGVISHRNIINVHIYVSEFWF
ncbi:fibulin-1 isoform X1 [Tachysurus vachellii]|uniref:fibulin-1 isoform X1 n=1 Tax=Tachysurus vachellii TaxID=175792 RepID=UPI00296A9C1A|nr:fibulin-1 isoform X1 [Tachysurus vachellii]